MSIIRRDVDMLMASVKKGNRMLGLDEARTVVGYVRVLDGREKTIKKQGEANQTDEELMAELLQYPRLREMVAAAANKNTMFQTEGDR
jgi:hypothetical protein